MRMITFIHYSIMTFWLFLVIIIRGTLSILETNSNNEVSELPEIIWWTDLVYPHWKKNTSVISCLNSSCISSKSRERRINNESIVAYIFYGTDFNAENLPLPRKHNHLWCLLHEESPMNNFMFSHTIGIQLFNFTGTFSRYSDFPLTTQFLPSINYLTKRKPISTSRKNQLRREGFAPVLYVQSHCHIASDRDRYVKELMKFINIDSYGTCLHNRDLPAHLNSTSSYDAEKFFDFIAQYKFHIAFENAVCEDYITEKFFRPLHVGSVPIYRGSPSIKDWAPSASSVIVADDFERPELLANYLKELDQNDTLYDNYLSYKTEVTNKYLSKTLHERPWGLYDPDKLDFINGFECFVCEKLTKISQGEFGTNFTKVAEKKHMNCQQPHVSLETDQNFSFKDEWMREDWIESYWFAFDQAKAIHKIIANNEKNSSQFWNYIMEMKYKY